MLHSLIKSISRYNRPKRYIAISFGKSYIDFLLVARNRVGFLVEKLDRLPVNLELFYKSPSDDYVDVISECIYPTIKHHLKSYIPINISLPDPIVSHGCFYLESIPSDKESLLKIADHRFSDGMNIRNNSRIYDIQMTKVGRHGGYLHGISVKEKIVDVIEKSFESMSASVMSINSQANQSHQLILRDEVKESSAWLDYETDYWTIKVWDSNKIQRYVRSCWVNNNDDKEYALSEFKRVVNLLPHIDSPIGVYSKYVSEEILDIVGDMTGVENFPLDELVLTDRSVDPNIRGRSLVSIASFL